MNTHHMKLMQEPFKKIADGQKIIESRLYDKKRRQINIGDHIKFTRTDDETKSITAIVRALYRYPSFSDLFSHFPPEDFGGSSEETLAEEIRKFYSSEEEHTYGVVGIKVELEK